MKTRIAIIAIVALMLGGCASVKQQADDLQIIQSVLNAILPSGFEGDLAGEHDGFYFGTSVHLEINLHGLKQQENGRWTWESGGYKRKGFFSQGGITLTPRIK